MADQLQFLAGKIFAWETPVAPRGRPQEILLAVAKWTSDSDPLGGVIAFAALCLLPHLGFVRQWPAEQNCSGCFIFLLFRLRPLNLIPLAERLSGTFSICFLHDFYLLFA
jgi:hypothetical protein